MEKTITKINEVLSEKFDRGISIRVTNTLSIPPMDDDSQFSIKFKFTVNGAGYRGWYLSNTDRAEINEFVYDTLHDDVFVLPNLVDFDGKCYALVGDGMITVERETKVLMTNDVAPSSIVELHEMLEDIDVSSIDMSDVYDRQVGYNFSDEECMLMYTNIPGNVLSDGSGRYTLIDLDVFNILPTRFKYCPAFSLLCDRIGFKQSRLEGFCDKYNLDPEMFLSNYKQFLQFEKDMGSDDEKMMEILTEK